jgi:hypothetical protein
MGVKTERSIQTVLPVTSFEREAGPNPGAAGSRAPSATLTLAGPPLRGHINSFGEFHAAPALLPWPAADAAALLPGGGDGAIRLWPARLIPGHSPGPAPAPAG